MKSRNSVMNVSQRCEEAKSICLKMDAGVAFMRSVQYIMSVKVTGGRMLVNAHASTVYAV
jgi:Iap family predicted aminopeptidase